MEVSFWQDLREKLKWYDVVALVLIVGGVSLLCVAIFSQYSPDETKIEYLSGSETEEAVKIWVDVGGAVINPGVYSLSPDSRIKDALIIAGGLSETADRELISKTINMAEKLRDGQKVYMAIINTPEGDTTDNGKENTYTKGVLININTASLSDLDSLWGVGVSRAQAVIDNRPYGSIEELTKKGIWPENVLEKNRERISVY